MIFADRNISTKKFLQNINLFVLALFASCLFACKDDPVTVNEEEFDPPRFNWRSMEISGNGYADIWASDTNNIYMINSRTSELNLIRNGVINKYNVGNYSLNKISGVSNSEVYIYATEYPENVLTIIKWNGVTFDYFPTGMRINGSDVYSIKGFAVNSNEIWICSPGGISKFDGNQYINYTYEDTTFIPIDIFLGNNNKLQVICEKSTQNNISQSLYEFQGSGFVKKFNYSKDPTINMSYIYLRQINGNMYGLELNRPVGKSWTTCIQNFSGSSFSQNYCFNDQIQTPHPSTRTNNPIGENMQDFISVVEAKDGFFEHTRIGVVNWNGSKFSREFELSSTGILELDAYLIYKIRKESYLIFQPNTNSNGNSKLHISFNK